MPKLPAPTLLVVGEVTRLADVAFDVEISSLAENEFPLQHDLAADYSTLSSTADEEFMS